jgi:hypothetical protein
MKLLCSLGRGRRREREDAPRWGEEIREYEAKLQRRRDVDAGSSGVPVNLCMSLCHPCSDGQSPLWVIPALQDLSGIDFKVLSVPTAHQVTRLLPTSTCSPSRNNSRPDTYRCCNILPAPHKLHSYISIRFN